MSSVTRDADSSPVQHSSDAASVVVGIPAYNEATQIGTVVLAARQYAREVVVVDDGSSDETGMVAREAGATVCSHDDNRGKGRAIATIFEHVEPREMDALVLLDGDGQHRPTDIPDVAEPVLEGESDLVVGNRYTETDADETPRHRRVGQVLLDTLTNGLAGAGVSDSQSGFRALSPEAVRELGITTDGMGVESEMVLSAADDDLRLTEVSVDVRYTDTGEHSLHPLAHGLTVVALLARCVGKRYPLVCVALPGVASGLVGVELARGGLVTAPVWRFGLSVLAFAVGTMLLTRGLNWFRDEHPRRWPSGTE